MNSSKHIACLVFIVTSATSFLLISAKSALLSNVAASIILFTDKTSNSTSSVVILSLYFLFATSGVFPSQNILALNTLETVTGSSLWQITSPLLLKNSSSTVIPTDIPAVTLSVLSFSCQYSIVLTFVVFPLGYITISSPAFKVPASNLPAIILLVSNLYTS
ncbi:hypothetical protein D3C81_607950 [compost metagenome]